MAKKQAQKKPKDGRNEPQRRKQYSVAFKKKVVAWKIQDKLTLTEISKKVKHELGYEISKSTLSTWWSPKYLEKLELATPETSSNTYDTRINRKQRPDVLVDMEMILARKVRAIPLNGIPYTRQVLQLLATHIYNKLLSYNLYDEHGLRKNPGERIDAEVIHSVEKCRLVAQYLSKSNNKTEHHKSKDASRNLPSAGNQCRLCPRAFKSEVNLTLHVYYHTLSEDDDAIDDPMGCEDEDEGEGEFRFTASTGWLYRFCQRHGVGKLKMKGEQGSADHDAVGPWILEWLTFLHSEYVLKHHKTLRQVINIICNFDECGFQYKSLPQYSYVDKTQEIRAKKPVLARITGLFGATMSGRKFKPLIIGKAKRPRAFSRLRNGEHLPVHYEHTQNAWQTSEKFRSWFLNCFLSEVGPILDEDMQVQFLIDNCSAHTPKHPDEALWMIDPNVCIKMLPPNTTSLIQPMDQAVLSCVKSYQKKAFYLKLMRYCESNEGEPATLFKQFLSNYDILEAIKDIATGWDLVSEATIKKSFRKVFDVKVWEDLCGEDEFEGFTGQEEQHPQEDLIATVRSDSLPGQEPSAVTDVVNEVFQDNIQVMTEHLNTLSPDIQFAKDDIIEDVLLNPGPNDDNLDTIISDYLGVQDDITCPDEVDNVPVQQDDHSTTTATTVTTTRDTRSIVLETLKTLQVLRSGDITLTMPPHRVEEWNKAVTHLEFLATRGFEKVKDSATTDAMPSSSGVSRDACVSKASTTRTTIISNRNESIDNKSDEVKYDSMDDLELCVVQNEELLYSNSDSELNLNSSRTDDNEELIVAKFTAINELKSRSKFERYKYSDNDSN